MNEIILKDNEIITDRDIFEATVKRINKLEKALINIGSWNLPEAEFQGKPCSYESAYGSNGARNYIINLANRALEK